MDVSCARPPQLFDLLAREWSLSSPVDGVVFNRNCETLAISCENGSIALAETADDDSPTARMRTAIDSGRQTIHRRGGPVPPLTEVVLPYVRTSVVVPLGERDFLIGCEGGEFITVKPDGNLSRSEQRMAGPITAVSGSGMSALFAGATDRTIRICRWNSTDAACEIRLDSPVSDLAFSPDGGHLAAIHDEGVSVWDAAGNPVHSMQHSQGSAPQSMRWSQDGRWIAFASQANGFCLIDLEYNQTRNFADYPTPARSIVFSKPANAVATSGAFRAAAWSLTPPCSDRETLKALPSGKPGFVSVDSIAASPDKDLLAVGYANGLLCITQIGSSEEMLLRQDDNTGISALSWSSDGSFLAAGMADGRAALVEFPTGMFK